MGIIQNFLAYYHMKNCISWEFDQTFFERVIAPFLLEYFIKRYDCTSPATFIEGISGKDFGMGRHLFLCQKQSFIL
jgi:hypothetical protein